LKKLIIIDAIRRDGTIFPRLPGGPINGCKLGFAAFRLLARIEQCPIPDSESGNVVPPDHLGSHSDPEFRRRTSFSIEHCPAQFLAALERSKILRFAARRGTSWNMGYCRHAKFDSLA
jgi:hypothetical protein